MQVQIILMVALTTIALWGCSNDDQTVSWYLSHPTERQEKMKWCQDDMQRMALPNCLNAAQATNEAWIESGRNYQPIN